MANQVEIVIKATDEASKVLAEFQGNAEKSLGSAEAAAEKSAQGLAMMAGAAALAATAAVGLGLAFAKSLSDLLGYAEGLQKANLSTGVSVELWQKLIKTGAEMDITFDSMRGAVERMEKNLEGSGEALRKFGIVAADFAGLNADEKVRALAVEIMAIEDPATRAAAAMAATGRSGAEMIPIFEAIVNGAVDAQKALGADMIGKLNATDAAVDSTKTAIKNLVEQLTAMVASTPLVTGFFNIMTMGFKGLGDMLAAWPGIWEAMRKGALLTTAEMFKAAVAAGTHEKALQGTSKSVLALAATNQKLHVALDQLVKMWGEETKAQEKNVAAAGVAAKKREALHNRELADMKKLNDANASLEEAERKRINSAINGEAELTNKWLAYESTRVATGLAANDQLEASHTAYSKSAEELDQKRTMSAIQGFELMASSASSILRSLWGKHKAAAIAAAIIDTIAAVVKTMAAYPWPWNLIPAAAAAVAGYAEVQKIRNQDAGFAQGTPGTAIMDFGTSTPTFLHGEEAVVTRPQGESIAGMVQDAIIAARRAGGTAAPGRVIVENHIHLDGREITASVDRRVRAGQRLAYRPGQG